MKLPRWRSMTATQAVRLSSLKENYGNANDQSKTTNPGKYNIGQQAKVIKSKLSCYSPPYLKLLGMCKDEHGFVTIRAVKEYANGKASVDIGNLLGGVWVPFEALLF